MEKYSKRIILLTMSLVMFITGVGVNIVEYCCPTCESESSLLGGDGCCSIFRFDKDDQVNDNCCRTIVHNCGETHSADNPGECDDISAKDCCTVYRASIDIEHIYSKHTVEKPIILLLDFLCIPAEIKPYYFGHNKPSADSHILHLQEPRDYLSLISVLII